MIGAFYCLYLDTKIKKKPPLLETIKRLSRGSIDKDVCNIWGAVRITRFENKSEKMFLFTSYLRGRILKMHLETGKSPLILPLLVQIRWNLSVHASGWINGQLAFCDQQLTLFTISISQDFWEYDLISSSL